MNVLFICVQSNATFGTCDAPPQKAAPKPGAGGEAGSTFSGVLGKKIFFNPLKLICRKCLKYF